MTPMGLLGLALTVLSVVAAYQLGFRAGLHDGRQLGFDDGKRAGAKEGSIRGYAVGFERGQRKQDSGASAVEMEQHRYPPLAVGLVVIAAICAVAYLAVTQRTAKTPPSAPSSSVWKAAEETDGAATWPTPKATSIERNQTSP